ncbi:glycoside hydrolase family 15 protein [soil metagenome]
MSARIASSRRARNMALLLSFALCVGAVGWPPPPAAAQSSAPGKPGRTSEWLPADKTGFGTSRGNASKVWYTLQRGRLSEVFYPTLGAPSVRSLQFIVTDGSSFADLEASGTIHETVLAKPRALVYRQVNEAKSGGYRLTKTYVTDPSRSTVLMRVHFKSLTDRPLRLIVAYDPALSNDGDDDTARSSRGALFSHDASAASALMTRPGLVRTSSGYVGRSGGWIDLRDDFKMDWHYRSAADGNVVQTGMTSLTGMPGRRSMTLALGFGPRVGAASRAALSSLRTGWAAAAGAYAGGWHRYMRSLEQMPASASKSPLLRRTYLASVMALAAAEDKTYRGAYIASPSMPWVWGTGLEDPSGPYHLVWSRDLYQIATGLWAAGDRAGAERALTFLFKRQQQPDGSFPQNTEVDGTPHWTSLQLDEVAFPLVMAQQMGRTGPAAYAQHVKPAADFIVANGPVTEQERWEEQDGYSPSTIAAEIAGLVCAADIARSNGDGASARKYLRTADRWRQKIEEWTVTTNGPLADHPYYLRLTKDGRPNAGTVYDIGNGGSDSVDQRTVADAGFLELVRLGIKRAGNTSIVESLPVVDKELRVRTPNGPYWHRYSGDGYGETRRGGPWDVSDPNTFRTIGRAWPIFAGERGEYRLAAERGARRLLRAIAAAGNRGYMIPEQVWDEHSPSGRPGFARGEGTFSATPLLWSHAQFIRLAWSMEVGAPIEQPKVVACRYVMACSR